MSSNIGEKHIKEVNKEHSSDGHGGNHDHGHHHNHELESRDIKTYGFWLYLMTDCILFGSLFIGFLVLSNGYPPYDFNMTTVIAETLILLTSSFTFGMAVLYMFKKNKMMLFLWIGVTFLLGIAFLVLEIDEFTHLYKEGYGMNAHAYFSSFFALVGTHGAHVFIGLIWMVCVAAQVAIHGITDRTTTKLLLLSLFWHFLDIVWIFVFSVVYLIGGI